MTQSKNHLTLLNQNQNEALSIFLAKYSALFPDDDIDKLKEIAVNSIKYYNGDKDFRTQTREIQQLETDWYRSLRSEGIPWYGVYGAPYYLADLWSCWIVYSRKYLKAIQKDNSLATFWDESKNISVFSDLGEVRSVVDLGCGIGYTTAALKQMFPKANVTGTNIPGTQQYEFCTMMSRLYNFNIVAGSDKIKNRTDLVFASEYFEHFENPIEHLKEVIQNLNPRNFLIANAFGSISIGHFDTYDIGRGVHLDGKRTSRVFNNTLRSLGYVKVETNMWNSRPTYWKQVTSSPL